MTPEQFAYWLQGFVEIRGSAPTAGEWEVIKDHLATVFNKVTPTYPMAAPYTPSPIPWTTSPTWVRPEITCSVSAAGSTVSNAYDFTSMVTKPQTNERFRF